MNKAFTFDDVLLIPQYNEISSRSKVDIATTCKQGKFQLTFPVFSANMDSITESAMCEYMRSKGGMGVLHRFMSVEKNIEEYEKFPDCFVSVGASDSEYKRFLDLRDAGATRVVVDIAHGHSRIVGDMIRRIKDTDPNVLVMAGNVCTYDGAKYLEDSGADLVKVGVGGGCLGAGTRILMSDGTYKNIEDIKIHDSVINKDGNSVEVIAVKYSGIKKVKKYKNNIFYKDTFVTPDHKHWVGDFSTTKDIQQVGLYKILDQPTKKEESKYKWLRLDNCLKTAFLLPKNIKFKMKNSFDINLGEFYESRRGFKEGFIEMKKIIPSYDLGYLIGTFLGDGHARLYCFRDSMENSKRNTNATVNWYFGTNEEEIAIKVQKSLFNVFEASSKIKKRRSMNIVENRNNYLARFFMQFGKKENKRLPEKYLCDNIDYLRGLYDGMLDSDGHYGNDSRNSFLNTSIYLCELFMLLSYKINGYYPSVCVRNPSAGGLKNCNIDNTKTSYSLRTVKNPDWNFTKDYQICRTYSIEDTEIEIPTYDIEVDCPTHSFIANNVIVHNSVCSTRIKTGHGYPQLSAIQECSKIGVSIIADGGLKNPSDCIKALAFGADFLMIGGILSGTFCTPGEPIYDGNKYVKSFRGMASKEANQDFFGGLSEWKTAEGVSITVPYKDKEQTEEIIQDIIGGLRSGLTYSGVDNIKSLQSNKKYIMITNNTLIENKPHKMG